MATLLHIECSPRKRRSASLEVASHFIDRYRQRHPETRVQRLDLWSTALPEFGEDAMAAKYAGLEGLPLSESQARAWNELRALAARLHEADILLFSVPLWNFGIPYKLKHFIDLVSQKDILFAFDAETGFEGLLKGKQAVAIYARGLDYAEGATLPGRDFDFQKPYLEGWLRFVGITDIASVSVEKTLFGQEVDVESRRQARRRAEAIADTLDSPRTAAGLGDEPEARATHGA